MVPMMSNFVIFAARSGNVPDDSQDVDFRYLSRLAGKCPRMATSMSIFIIFCVPSILISVIAHSQLGSEREDCQ